MSEAPILLDVDGVVATITLNNPAKRNALTLQAWRDLSDAIDQVNGDLSLRCVVVRGAGDQAFAAGADISEFPHLRSNAEQAIAYGAVNERALDKLLHCVHPTVAMIQGACTGGGLEIAACCDLRVASDTARFGVPINRIGHAFAASEMKPVLDLVGPAVVFELLLEGAILDADAAREKGLVNRVVPADQFEGHMAESVARITAGAPLAARMTKRVLNRLRNDPAPLDDAETAETYAPCDSEDYAEGVAAFLDKRKPNFYGR